MVGYGDLKSLQESEIDILSMIKVEEDNDEDNSDGEKIVEEQILKKTKLERHLSHSPLSSRKILSRDEHDTWSLYGETGALLADNELTLNAQYKAKSAHDLGKNMHSNGPSIAFRPQSPPLGRAASHYHRDRTTSFRSMCASQMDLDLTDREDVIILVGLR